MHSLLPTKAANLPFGQILQVLTPPHVSLYRPAGHCAHCVASSVTENPPPAQQSQWLYASAAWNLPAGQCAQLTDELVCAN
jgi:hypothetical protein